MCILQLSVYTSSDMLDVSVDCGYMKVASEWVETLAKRTSWPGSEIHRLDLWPDEPPFVVHLANVWGARVEPCARYLAIKQTLQQSPKDDSDVSPDKEFE